MIPRPLLALAALIGAGAALPASAAAFEAGTRQIVIPSEARHGHLDVTLWYPAQVGGEKTALGESKFFSGVPALRDAPMARGSFPLILLSHGAGLGGYPQAASWIAAPLAQRGFMVAAPAHPGNSGRNRSASETMKVWLRPGDLSETLDGIEKDLTFKSHLDAGKVAVLGLSMGGSTALAIAGARFDPRLLAGYCDTNARNPSLCTWVRDSGVDLHRLDLRSAGGDQRDRRIAFAMAVDPAPVDVFDFSSFSEIAIPVEIVNLGSPGKIPTTAEASGAAKAIPYANYQVIPDASHFSMFPECKPGAAEIAKAAQIEEKICDDAGERPRSAIHAQLIDMVAAAFLRALQSAQ